MTPASPAPAVVSRDAALMGGRVGVHLLPGSSPADAIRDGDLILRRIGAWADQLTRFRPSSDLSRLNADVRTVIPVRPTLAAVLDWGRAAEAATDSIVNIAMLDHRLAAEEADSGPTTVAVEATQARASDAWSMDRGARTTWIRRPADLRFDLDGVGKGWIADRALALLDRYPAAVVDADGDIAIRLAPGEAWWIGIGDAEDPELDLATLRLAGETWAGPTRFGVATSGTSVHRWKHDGVSGHHLIDPRTGLPAETDVVQATVISGSARHAEAFAKAAVILGSAAALVALDRSSVDGAVLLTDEGQLLILPRTLRYLS